MDRIRIQGAVFISFEGGEGSGKSTQAQILASRLPESATPAKYIREPGGTELGDDYVRDLIKRGLPKEKVISDHAELLLFSASRAEIVSKVIKPCLATPGAVVIADRYVDSTTAYQGYGRGIPLKQVEVVNALATQGVMPDLTFLLDISPVDGLMRIGDLQLGFQFDDSVLHPDEARAREGARFEDEPLEFHERVRQGYLKIAAKQPDRFCVIDATLPKSEISERIWKIVCDRFPKLGAIADGERL